MFFSKEYEDCYINLKDNLLKIGNSRFERVWCMQGGAPSVLSLKNKSTGKEWLSQGDDPGWTTVMKEKSTFWKQGMAAGDAEVLSVTAAIDDDLGTAAKHLRIEVELDFPLTRIKWVHMVYPGVPLIRNFLSCRTKTKIIPAVTQEKGGCIDNLEIENSAPDSIPEDYLDYFPLEPRHCQWRSIRFNDVTDHHSNLVQVNNGLFYWKETELLQANLLFVREPVSENGLVLIKEGPTPLAYQGDTAHDFRIQANNIFTCGWGFTGDEISRYNYLTGYGSAVILWDGGEEQALLALRDYHHAIHKFVPEKDAFVMCNTWGDRSKDGRLSEAFILQELEIAARLGINYYQIDDGWQKGTTVNSVNDGGIWEGYYKNDSDFWDVNQLRFPNSLIPITESAGKKAINLALWFSPDSTGDFANWDRDANTLLGLHRKHGVVSFKLDGIKLRSKKGEENLFRMLQKVVAETGGKVFFNLDVTAEVRNGYYGRVQYACLFLENRYTDWGNYYPHWTLRNLWMLSRYYPSFKLQAEFLNVKRNMQNYNGDVLAPAACGIEYSFAVTMFANPLAWMELTGLEEESAAILEKMIPVYRKVQSELLSGYVLPVGEEPCGTAWTGFQSITGENSGYILVIKEYSPMDRSSLKLWKLKGARLNMKKILGTGSNRVLETDDRGNAVFEMKGHFQYCLYQYRVI